MTTPDPTPHDAASSDPTSTPVPPPVAPPASQQPYAQPQEPIGQPQQPVGQPYGGTAPAGQTNILAIISLIAAFVISPVGIVLGFIARNQIKQTGEAGDGLAKAGIIVGIVFTALTILLIVFSVLLPIIIFSALGTSY